MKIIILLFALAAPIFANDLDPMEANNGGHKAPQQQNDVSNNGHQKPQNLKYTNLQQAPPSTQAPAYPVAQDSYQQVDSYQQPIVPPAYSFLPPQTQAIPLHFSPQPLSVPKFQLVAAKNANGQTQLALIPHSVYMGYLGYGNIPQILQQPLTNNLAQEPQASVQTASTTNYVTPQPPTNQQPTNAAALTQAAYYANPANDYAQVANPQAYSNYLYNQNPQVYNYVPQQQVYSPGQQYVNYYQANPQAKYSYLYGAGAQQGSYQTSAYNTEYDKYSQPAQPIQKREREVSLNTNEFLPSQDTHFKPMTSHLTRSHPYYNYKY